MAQDEKNPVFTQQMRKQLRHQRIFVLDGVLDDDNGTLPSYPRLRCSAIAVPARRCAWRLRRGTLEVGPLRCSSLGATYQ